MNVPQEPGRELATGGLSVPNLIRAAGVEARLCNHTWRASGITNFLTNGGALEMAQYMAGHADPRTTKLYDRRKQMVTQQEVERIRYERKPG